MRRKPRRDVESLPYGIWTTDDGEILFDRRYRPMWHRSAQGEVTQMSGDEWIRHDRQDYLYWGVTDKKLRAQLMQAEADFIAGLVIKTPIRPLDLCFRRERPKLAAKPVLTLIVCNTSTR